MENPSSATQREIGNIPEQHHSTSLDELFDDNLALALKRTNRAATLGQLIERIDAAGAVQELHRVGASRGNKIIKTLKQLTEESTSSTA